MRSVLFLRSRNSGVLLLRSALLPFWIVSILFVSSATAQTIVATSGDGARDWEDSSTWSFDLPPSAATAPGNDGVDFFDVRIDGGGAVDSAVLLSTAVAVDRLEISAGDSLNIREGAGLTIDSDPLRVGSGQIVNDGLIVLAGPTAITTLDTGGAFSISISGSGALRMSGNAELGTFGLFPPSDRRFISHGPDHRIEGSGLIRQSLLNDGTISANADEVLRLGGQRLEQRGTLEATGSGGLEILARETTMNTGTIRALGSSISSFSLTNDGLIEVLRGGEFTAVSPVTNNGLIDLSQGGEFVSQDLLTNEADGRIVVRGSGSRFSGSLFNRGGLVEILDGGRADFNRLNVSGTFRVGQESMLDSTGGAVVSGILDLDGGTIRTIDAGMGILGSGRVVGSGRIELGSGKLGFNFLGLLAPGDSDGVGEFEIIGDVDVLCRSCFGRPQIEIQLGGTGAGEFDRLTIDGTLSLMGSVVVELVDFADPSNPTGVFDPAVGSVFDIFTATEIVELSGSFSLPSFDDGREFMHDVVRVGSVDVLRLIVIPEPSTAALLGMGFLLLASTKRRESDARIAS